MIGQDGPTDPELIRFLREELGETGPLVGPQQCTGPLWIWRGKKKDGTPTSVVWHFLTIDGAAADAVRAAAPGRSAAWGSVYVKASIGKTHWQTSVFPSKDIGGYMLPIKASVRKAERLAEGDVITVSPPHPQAPAPPTASTAEASAAPTKTGFTPSRLPTSTT